MSDNLVGQHRFRALRWYDALSGGPGRCRHCFEPKRRHPVLDWVAARPWGNKERPRV